MLGLITELILLAHFVDASNIDLGAAWSWKSGESAASIAANTLFSALDGEYNKRDIGVMGTYAKRDQ